jgi:hypothetical protein
MWFPALLAICTVSLGSAIRPQEPGNRSPCPLEDPVRFDTDTLALKWGGNESIGGPYSGRPRDPLPPPIRPDTWLVIDAPVPARSGLATPSCVHTTCSTRAVRCQPRDPLAMGGAEVASLEDPGNG